MTQRPHEAKWSHELIGGAAAYEAMKAYEDHEARNGKRNTSLDSKTHGLTSCTGKIDDHAKAKEIIAGLAGAFIDREVETKGLDFIDREKAKHHAKESYERSMERSDRW